LIDKVDYMAVSFVQKGADIQELVDLISGSPLGRISAESRADLGLISG